MRQLLGLLARRISNSTTYRRLAVHNRDRRQRSAERQLQHFNSYERRVYSQNGEDGLLAELFARIPNARFAVEIGVEDGVESNSALLVKHYGWSALMVEADTALFESLRNGFADFPVTAINSRVDRDNAAKVLNDNNVPITFDLLSIDIDGNDYYIWESLEAFRPSVVIIEYNASFGPVESKTIVYDATRTWDKSLYFGASLAALTKLGKRLNYALVGTNLRGVNAFFVRRDLLPIVGFPEKDVAKAFHRKNLLDGLLPSGSGDFFFP